MGILSASASIERRESKTDKDALGSYFRTTVTTEDNTRPTSRYFHVISLKLEERLLEKVNSNHPDLCAPTCLLCNNANVAFMNQGCVFIIIKVTCLPRAAVLCISSKSFLRN
ncbi:hypothetical protein Y032_0010g1055 [Ancylostoma ceylanicum]|uniref:Uncharacterized protein n=1 Tax=Ancylostoma ceylanicum TaxID=53326 RepID=A0A016VGW2_9BILA|nr:hypothetical protein Y032_0010g1055 [Ancylostoma ceylanicum]